MLVETKAIVLHSIKYNDSSLIAHCYTETLGIQSFMLKGILSAKKGKYASSFSAFDLVKFTISTQKQRRIKFYQRA